MISFGINQPSKLSRVHIHKISIATLEAHALSKTALHVHVLYL